MGLGRFLWLCLCTVDIQVASVLPLSHLLLGVETYLDQYLQGRWEEIPIYNLSESLSAF